MPLNVFEFLILLLVLVAVLLILDTISDDKLEIRQKIIDCHKLVGLLVLFSGGVAVMPCILYGDLQHLPFF